MAVTDWHVTKFDPVDPMTREEWMTASRWWVEVGVEILQRINARHPELLEYLKQGDYANADRIVVKAIYEEGLG